MYEKDIAININFFLYNLTCEDWKDCGCKKRLIVGNEAKYYFFYTDIDMYTYGNSDLSDLRIVNKNGEEVQYYRDEFNIDLKKENILFKSKRTFYEDVFDNNKKFINRKIIYQILEDEQNIKINRLIFDVKDISYSAQIELYGRNDKGDFQFITKDTIYKIDDNIDDNIKNYVMFDGTKKYKYYQVLVNYQNININDIKFEFIEGYKSINPFLKKTKLSFKVTKVTNSTYVLVENLSRLRLNSIKFDINSFFFKEI